MAPDLTPNWSSFCGAGHQNGRKGLNGSTSRCQPILRCAADEACNSAYPDLQDTLFEVIDQLNAEPIPISLTNPLDGQRYDVI